MTHKTMAIAHGPTLGRGPTIAGKPCHGSDEEIAYRFTPLLAAPGRVQIDGVFSKEISEAAPTDISDVNSVALGDKSIVGFERLTLNSFFLCILNVSDSVPVPERGFFGLQTGYFSYAHSAFYLVLILIPDKAILGLETRLEVSGGGLR